MVRHNNAKLTPDGRTVFSYAAPHLRSYKVDSGNLLEGPKVLVPSVFEIFVSPDSQFVCMTSLMNRIDLYAVADLSKPAFQLTTKSRSVCVAFDSVAKIVYAIDSKNGLSANTFEGVKLKDFVLPTTAGCPYQMICSPRGGQLLIRHSHRISHVDTQALSKLSR
jgi:hypothetical protein